MDAHPLILFLVFYFKVQPIHPFGSDSQKTHLKALNYRLCGVKQKMTVLYSVMLRIIPPVVVHGNYTHSDNNEQLTIHSLLYL